MTIDLSDYIRQEVDSWYADTGAEPPASDEIDQVVHDLTRWASDEIKTAICNACA